MCRVAGLLAQQFAEAQQRLEHRIVGLSDSEFYWEPVPGCWTVRPRSTATTALANGKGDWVCDYELPDPDPPPFTTIAWRLVHLCIVNSMYLDFMFGPASADFDDFDIPNTAATAVAWWKRSGADLYPEFVA